LEKAAQCEHLAHGCSTSSNEHLLLETAKHWRGLAGSWPLQVPNDRDRGLSPAPLDAATLARLLSEAGSPIR